MSNKQKLKLRLLSKRKAESKLFDKLFGVYDDSDSRETWWDYVTGEDFVK